MGQPHSINKIKSDFERKKKKEMSRGLVFLGPSRDELNDDNIKKSTYNIDNVITTNSNLPYINLENEELSRLKRPGQDKLISQDEDFEFISDALSRHYLLKFLEKNVVNDLVKRFTLYTLESKMVLFSRGQLGSNFYIIKEGTVDLSLNDKAFKSISKGNCFGMRSHINSSTRTYTATSKSKCLFWVLDFENIIKLIELIKKSNYEENKQFVISLKLLSSVETEIKHYFAANIFKEQYIPKEQIIIENEKGYSLFVIKEGEVECKSKDKVIRILRKGDYFGEKSLLLGLPRSKDIFARTKVICYSFSLNTFKSIIGDSFREQLLFNFLKVSFFNSDLFRKFNRRLLDNVMNLFTLRNYTKGEIVLTEGYPVCSKIMVIIQGSLYNVNLNHYFRPKHRCYLPIKVK